MFKVSSWADTDRTGGRDRDYRLHEEVVGKIASNLKRTSCCNLPCISSSTTILFKAWKPVSGFIYFENTRRGWCHHHDKLWKKLDFSTQKIQYSLDTTTTTAEDCEEECEIRFRKRRRWWPCRQAMSRVLSLSFISSSLSNVLFVSWDH